MQWNLPIADIPNSGYAMNTMNSVPNVKIFLKLLPNNGHLSITGNFLRPVGVRYSEISLYKKNNPIF